jgi:hypothetical protein
MAVLNPSICCRQSTPAEILQSQASIARLRAPDGWAMRFLLCALLLLLAPSAIHAQSKEYQVKAAFLYNFAQFVSWPETAFTNADEPFQIGILGENPFGGDLNETVRGEAIHGHRIAIVESRRAESLADCQIVFISKAEAAHAADVFSKLGSKPILTVSEISGFTRHGGVINFYRDGSKVRFEINPDAAEKNSLKLGSELLSVGKIIHTEAAPK